VLTDCSGKVDFYTKNRNLPATKAELQRQERSCDILIGEGENLIETSKSQKEELEERPGISSRLLVFNNK
jgi:hypothetical protein